MALIDFAHFRNRVPSAAMRSKSKRSGAAVLLPFPEVAEGDFVADIRRTLARFALTAPNIFPIQFGSLDGGAEFCRLTNGFTIGRDRNGRYSITDVRSGYIDHGPFDNLYEVCRLITWLGV